MAAPDDGHKRKSPLAGGLVQQETTESEPIMNVLIPAVNTVTMTSLELMGREVQQGIA